MPTDPKKIPRPNVSKTSMGVFDECERKWALQYANWIIPDDIRLDVKYQAKLMPSEALVGQVVDDTITHAIRHFHQKGKWPRDIQSGAKPIFEQYFRETEIWMNAYMMKGDLPSLRRQPIDRVFYNRPFTPPELETLYADADRCISNWILSGIPERIAKVDRQYWHPPVESEIPWFVDNGVPVWAKFDFMMLQPGEATIYDWKTGKVTAEKEAGANAQLHTYALYAMHEFKIPIESVRLVAAWLSVGAKCEIEYRVDQKLIEVLRVGWAERHKTLSARAKEYGRDARALFKLFPMTGFPAKCTRCPFHACEGYLARNH